MKAVLTALAAFMAASVWAQSPDFDFGRAAEKAAGAIINGALAKRGQSDLKGMAARYNAEQPSFAFGGATLEVGFGTTPYWWSSEIRDWRQAGVSQSLTALDARPVWDRHGVETESSDRGYYRGNDEVDQTSMPAKGTILVATFKLELSFVQLEKSEDFSIFLGRWSRGLDFRLSRETAYCGITATIRDRATGSVIAVYKILESASSADNVGGSVASGFFGNQLGGSYRSDSREALRLRAEEKALKALSDVFKSKNSTRVGRGG